MNQSTSEIALQLFQQAFDKPERNKLPTLRKYLDNGGSVCLLAQKGVNGLVAEYGLDHQQARDFLYRVNGLATKVLREFIQYSQIDAKSSLEPQYGLGSGPTYELLFNPKFGKLCPPGAIEAVNSPAAYLTALMHWALNRLGAAGEGALPLIGRRPDLEALFVDVQAVHGSVSSVEVISKVMEAYITGVNPVIIDVDRTLNQRYFPNGLPFHTPWVTINHVMQNVGESVGSVVRLCDRFYPYFIRSAHRTDVSGWAFSQATRLSPSQRSILTEVEGEGETEEFCERYFGTVGLDWQNLKRIWMFNRRTGMNYRSLEELLSIKDHSITLTDNFVPPDNAGDWEPTGAKSGSFYVNGGTDPALTIVFEVDGLNPSYLHRFSEHDIDKLARMNRKLRLDKWLGMESDEVDEILRATTVAEESQEVPAYTITESTVQALGLFQELRERLKITAEDFAILFGYISIFGRGTRKSHFDRIFNARSFIAQPLIIDNAAFAIIPVSDADKLTANQLRAGLGVDQETYLYLALMIASANNVTELTRSLPIISSFYRLARLPRLLGISPIESILLMNMLGGESWVIALAANPGITPNAKLTLDTLEIVHALMDCVRWCRNAELSMHWVVEQVTPAVTSAQPAQAETDLFAQVRNQLPPVVLTEEAFSVAGVAPLTNNRRWLYALRALVDDRGLIAHFAETPDQTYEDYARDGVERAVTVAIGGGDRDALLIVVEKILAVLLRYRAGQHGVVVGSFAGYTGLAAELVEPVLTWSGGTVHGVLAHVLAQLPDSTDDNGNTARRQEPELPGNYLLQMLVEFRRRSAVASTLKLSAGFLTYFMRTGHSRWFGLHQAPGFSISTLYHLTVYQRAVKLSGQPEHKLLDYMQRVSTLPDDLIGDSKALVVERAARILAELFTWSVREVLACAVHVNPESNVIRTIEHLDLLVRVRLLSSESGLDAGTILEVGALRADSPFEKYSLVADNVMASLSHDADPALTEDVESAGQDVQVECAVSHPRLVANKSNDVSVVTVTVKNRAKVPLKNVRVHLRSELGALEKQLIATNENGVATVNLKAGQRMGVAWVNFWLDLGINRVAPPVEIGADPGLADFPAYYMSPVPTGPVLVGTPVTLFVTVMDNYGNRVADEPLRWTMDTLIVHQFSTTNSRGFSEITFTSEDPEDVEVSVNRVNGTQGITFQKIKFVAPARAQ